MVGFLRPDFQYLILRAAISNPHTGEEVIEAIEITFAEPDHVDPDDLIGQALAFIAPRYFELDERRGLSKRNTPGTRSVDR